MTNAKARRRARAAIVEFGLRMQVERLGYWTSGNLSMRVPGDPDLIVVSPSATPWDLVEPEDVPLVRLDGKVLDGAGRPTSELPLHTLLYQRRPEIAAIVHVHSPAAMAMAALDWTLPRVPHRPRRGDRRRRRLRAVRPTGQRELADAVAGALEGRGACFLRHHGLLAVGATLPRAFQAAAVTEGAADAYLRARAVGSVKDLDPAEVAWIAAAWDAQWTGEETGARG